MKLQYDGWADTPIPTILSRSPTPTVTCWHQRHTRHPRHGVSHRHLDDPARETYREGLTEFVMLPHAPLTTYPPAQIEAGYRRPER